MRTNESMIGMNVLVIWVVTKTQNGTEQWQNVLSHSAY